MTKAFIDTNVDGRLKVSTPYLPEFVADLKATIPYSGREWVKILKAWLVEPNYKKEIVELCQKHFTEVHVNIDEGSKSTDVEEVYAQLFLTPNAPFWLVTRVWKFLAIEFHPDKNKDGAETMKVINQAYQEIKSLEEATR
jgi:hypothetical protein